jgi:hypothetical protein
MKNHSYNKKTHFKDETLAIVLSGAGRGLMWGAGGSELTNVRCKTIGDCHNDSSL